MSTFRTALETIEGRLSSAPLDEAAVGRCAAELSVLGSEITAQIEAEFVASIAADAEPNAA